MQLQQQHDQESLQRARSYLDTHADVVGPLEGSEARQQLDDSLGKLDAHTLAQSTAKLEASGQKERQRQQYFAAQASHVVHQRR